MSILDGLDSAFIAKMDALINDCAASGIVMKPYFGVRDPVTQAKLWRQSRSLAEIETAKASLLSQGAPYLAACIDKAGPQPTGKWKTNAMPGYSWHQWGLACDCVWVRNGVYVWDEDTDGSANGYRIYAAKAAAHDLTSMSKIGDWDHVQSVVWGSPTAKYTAAQIDAAMKAKFGRTP